jgi:hypothetical protein
MAKTDGSLSQAFSHVLTYLPYELLYSRAILVDGQLPAPSITDHSLRALHEAWLSRNQGRIKVMSAFVSLDDPMSRVEWRRASSIMSVARRSKR